MLRYVFIGIKRMCPFRKKYLVASRTLILIIDIHNIENRQNYLFSKG